MYSAVPVTLAWLSRRGIERPTSRRARALRFTFGGASTIVPAGSLNRVGIVIQPLWGVCARRDPAHGARARAPSLACRLRCRECLRWVALLRQLRPLPLRITVLREICR